MKEQDFKDELPANMAEVFDDDKDLYRYLYQFESQDKNANLVLAYLHAEPKKKTFIRNQRKLMTLINDFLISKMKALETHVYNQTITINEETKKIEYIIKINETQETAKKRIIDEAKDIREKIIETTKDATDFLYNIIESISILERNREDNHFANKGFGQKENMERSELDNILLKKTLDEEKEKKR
jgi:hypothetical protein